MFIIIRGNKINEYFPGLASDYSDICYDSINKQFCILSDEDRSVFLWHPLYGLSEKYEIDVENPEGLAVGKDGTLYVVSDKKRTLYIFNSFIKGKK